jgi:hypothetical protein
MIRIMVDPAGNKTMEGTARMHTNAVVASPDYYLNDLASASHAEVLNEIVASLCWGVVEGNEWVPLSAGPTVKPDAAVLEACRAYNTAYNPSKPKPKYRLVANISEKEMPPLQYEPG